MLYANYIRNKMRHLYKTIFASGYPLKIISKFNKKAVDYTIHGKTEIGKNLISYPYINTTKTTNGVTYTDNGDGSVSVSGTATGYSDFFFKIMSIAPNTTFTFSKNQSDDAANIAFTLRQLDENRALIGKEISLIPTVVTHTFTTVENARYIQIACKRYANAECKGTYKPMLELGDTATEYEPYTVYGVGDKTKNLIPYPYSGFGGEKTKMINGITFTDNGGGLITLNGTATEDVEFNFTGDFALPPGNFQISINHDYQDFYLGLDEREGNPDKNGNYIVYCDLIVSKGVTINNGTCRPQIELGNTATDYEPYGYKIPLVNRGNNLSHITNVYHTTPLKDGESISYKADGLPELQLYKGENNITADTAVAPSAIDIKYLN